MAKFLTRIRDELSMRGRQNEFGLCASHQKSPDALGDDTPRRNHIVSDQARPAGHLSGHVGHFGRSAVSATLVQHDNWRVEPLHVVVRHRDTARVRRDDNYPCRQTASQCPAKRRHSPQTIHRHMKNALDLRGVRIDGDDLIVPNGFWKIGDHPRHDRLSPATPLV